jgi:5'-3' exonuclease
MHGLHGAPSKPYKGHRGVKTNDLYTQWSAVIKSHLLYRWGFQVTPGYIEADDAVSIVARGCWDKSEDFVIIGNDKDLHQIPGKHYNYKSRVWTNMAPVNSEAFKYKQLLMGDSTDNIGGIPKIGPKKADTILKGASNIASMKYLVLAEYIKYYGQRVGILKYAENANLLFMMESADEMPDEIKKEFTSIEVMYNEHRDIFGL